MRWLDAFTDTLVALLYGTPDLDRPLPSLAAKLTVLALLGAVITFAIAARLAG